MTAQDPTKKCVKQTVILHHRFGGSRLTPEPKALHPKPKPLLCEDKWPFFDVVVSAVAKDDKASTSQVQGLGFRVKLV